MGDGWTTTTYLAWPFLDSFTSDTPRSMPLPELIPVSFGSRTPPISSNTPYTSANTFTPPNANAELNIKHQRLEPYTTGAINVLLLENISANAAKIFKDAGFNVC